MFGHPAPLKQALDKSGIYSSVVGDLLKQDQGNKQSDNSNVPVNNPAVQAVIKQAFPASFLQTQTEKVLDAVYGWVDGGRPALQFSVDLSGAKASLANGLGQYASSRLATLPTCTPDALPSGDIDAFTATCLPAGFDKNAAAAQARDNILNGDFLKDSQLTQDTKQGDGKPLAQGLQKAPDAYRHIRGGIISAGVLAALLAVGVVFLSATWRVGVRKVSVIAITVGATSAIFALLSSFAVRRVLQKIESHPGANTSLHQHVGAVAQQLVDDVHSHWLVYGIVLIVGGVAALVALKLTAPKNPIDISPKKPSTYVGHEPEDSGEEPGTETTKPVRRPHTAPEGDAHPPKPRAAA